MTRYPLQELSVDAAYRRLQSDAHQRFEAAMNSGKPIVDNASDRLYAIGELEYDGPRCANAKDCDTAVEDDGDRCEGCAELDDHCRECGTDVARPGLCFDCDVRASYVGGLAPRFGAQP